MEYFIVIGLVAATCTTISFFPQVLKTWKMKETRDISLGMYIILNVGVFLWLVYGLLINDLPIIIANAITIVLTLSVLYLKIKYG